MIELQEKIPSPFKEGEFAKLKWEERQLWYKKEAFIVSCPYYKCEATYQEFTTDESDQVIMDCLVSEYSIRHLSGLTSGKGVTGTF